MKTPITVVIPNYNMASTIGLCLEAAFCSDYGNFEVVVVDEQVVIGESQGIDLGRDPAAEAGSAVVGDDRVGTDRDVLTVVAEGRDEDAATETG